MKTLMVCFLLVPASCFANPRFARQTFGGGGIDPSFGPGFGGGGDPNSPFNSNAMMGRNGMDGIFGSPFNQGQGQFAPYNRYGYNGPRGYGDSVRGYTGEGRSTYVYEPRQQQQYAGLNMPMYEPRQRFGVGPSMYQPTGRFSAGNNDMGGDQFIGSDPNIANGMSGMTGMGGMGGDLGQLASFGGGMGGDGMDDMVRMQAEMQQMQQQMKKAAPATNVAVNVPKGNTSTNVEKIGENMLVTNQTRFLDTNDGLTQGFFQEFHIFPGMETTTSGSNAGKASIDQTTGRPDTESAVAAGKHNTLIDPAAIFGFAPPDNFFNPRKVTPLTAQSAASLQKDRDSNLLPGEANEVKGAQHRSVKKAFSTDKSEVLVDRFSRAFDGL
ncbi:hypothetical protein BV898_02443 [Hypsibius exemplaris]|uniref:Uncharacterized protein n=1 Tax=Hypsibius exemplaris TaxID=2072580 RepID=A0A1W0X861_HYPEX|nr:hypothetical protein BV898_02443 [Hypsibius exemplaris]